MMFPGARSYLNPCLVCCVSRPDQPLSSYRIDVLASRLSPDTKDICRDNSTTVGIHRRAAHGGVEFLEGFLSGIQKLAIDQEKKNQHWKKYD